MSSIRLSVRKSMRRSSSHRIQVKENSKENSFHTFSVIHCSEFSHSRNLVCRNAERISRYFFLGAAGLCGYSPCNRICPTNGQFGELILVFGIEKAGHLDPPLVQSKLFFWRHNRFFESFGRSYSNDRFCRDLNFFTRGRVSAHSGFSFDED